jgi:predicted acylesterase/phospholipase RssA
MKPDSKAVAPNPTIDVTGKHLVCGAGGSRAILASAGAVMATRFAGITEWQTIGGISGGSIPAVALAAGIDPRELMQLTVDVEFSSLVPRHATPLSMVLAFILKDRFEYTRPKKGVLSSENLGKFIDSLVPVWPKNFWTMAVVARTQILFTDHGVFQILKNGQRRVLSDTPAPVGLAIRATCAIPGIIDAVEYKKRLLHDGALSWDGACPVGIPQRHFGAKAKDVIGCDVGDEPSRFAPLARLFWTLLCGGHCVDHTGPKTPIAPEVLMVNARPTSVRSLQFSPTVDQKWMAVHAGFQEAIVQFTKAGLLKGDKLTEALDLCASLEAFKALAAK